MQPWLRRLYGLGLRENMPHLERLVRGPSSRELGIIDPEVLIPALHRRPWVSATPVLMTGS